ncbi:MAG: molybdopterin-guanine dinucleotide biosynthesis protein B [Deltaproteobacteria bacterium]|nr:molybdopterin-guanine dinucleotide biosynthesis protein B [Deltaproteobacteria bacterium]
MERDTVVPPVVCVVGSSGAGKTTLLEKLIPELNRLGLKVGTIKHDVHGFEIDKPGKDSYRLKHAGAVVSIISSPVKVGVVMDAEHDPGLAELAPFYSGVDIVLTEGYKRENYPKIEVFRKEVHPPLELTVPRFDPDEIDELAGFLIEKFFAGEEQIEGEFR